MMGSAGEQRIEEAISYPILLSERVRSAIDDAESSKLECAEMGKQVDRLSQMLRSAVRLATSTPSLYERPIRRVVSDVSKNLERALTLVRKCKRRSVLKLVVNITSNTDFRKVSGLLDASIGDMRWLLGVFDSDGSGGGGGGIVLSLPPIASTDPILAWVWPSIATLQMGQLSGRIEAANELASLAKDNDRNKKVIVEEGGISPLLKLLKESTSPEAQVAAGTALLNLANDQERVGMIVDEAGVPVIVKVLGDSPIKVQIQVAYLVARMAEHDSGAQEDFAREKAIRPLVSMLSFETFVDDLKLNYPGMQSIHSIVQINKEMENNPSMPSNHHHPRPYANSYSSLHSDSSTSRGVQHRRERENEKPEVKLKLKTSCAEALCMLARGSVSNSQKITETKGLLCLAKIVEKEYGELQLNCLMTIMEIAAAAESNADLRRAAFKTNSPAAKAVVDQLLRVIKEEEHNQALQIPAIRSIGSLARTFTTKETRVISLLVARLNHQNQDVATAAAIALGKFACPDNFLHVEHSKAIIEFNVITPLLRLLRCKEKTQLQALILLCDLVIHAGDSEALEHARVLTTLEGADRSVAAQSPELIELVSKAIYHLNLYHAGVPHQRES